MRNTSGIVIERNSFGKPTFARINLNKYGKDLKDFFHRYDIAVDEEELQNPAVTGVVPKGYVTLEEFRKIEIDRTKQFCIDNGIY